MWLEAKEPIRPQKRLEPYAAINPRGEIVLNSVVFPHLEGLYTVALHYHAEWHAIRISRPTLSGRIYHVRRYGRRGRMRIIGAIRFLRTFALEVPRETLVIPDLRAEPAGGVVYLMLPRERAADEESE